MGLFDFILGKGKKLDVPEPAPQPQVTPEAFQRVKDQRRADGLAQLVKGLGLEVEGLAIEVAGDKATLRGKPASQAVREKVILAVGNVEGIAKVDDQMEVVAVEPPAVFYTVERGGTLGAIAKKFYGKAGAYPKIFEANKPMLDNPDKIYPGQVLRIPDAEPPKA